MTAVAEPAVQADQEVIPAVTLDARDLLTVLVNASLFAGTDDTLPILNAVRLEARGGFLHGYGTDRYRVGEVRVPLERSDGEDFAVTLSVKTVRTWVPILKSAVLAQKGVRVQETTLTEDHGTVTLECFTATVRAAAVDGDYPKIRGLFFTEEPKFEGGTMGFNPAYFASFTKVQDFKNGTRNLPLVFVPGPNPNKPHMFLFEDWFRGLIMPVRGFAGQEVQTRLDSWA